MNPFKKLFKPLVQDNQPRYSFSNMRIEPYPKKPVIDLFRIYSEDYEATMSAEPLPDSTKPCRFLKEMVADSSDAGIPCGIYRVCAHPFFSERVIDVALQSIHKIRKCLRGVDELMTGRAESPIELSPQATAEMMSDLLAETLNWADHTERVLISGRERYPSAEDAEHKKWLTKTAEEERIERAVETRPLGDKL